MAGGGLDVPVHGSSLTSPSSRTGESLSARSQKRSDAVPSGAAGNAEEDEIVSTENTSEPAAAGRIVVAGIDPLDELRERITSLEREVRFLRHHLDQSDPAGRPPFRRPEHVTIGEASRIGHGVTMSATERTPIDIGTNTRVLRGTEILGPTTIGNRVFLNRDVYVRSRVTIEDGASIGPYVRLISDSHTVGPPEHRAGPGKTEPIVIGEGAWIGAGATVLGGVTIGAGAVIAAGAVVTTDIPPNTVAAGVPARQVRAIVE